jgi:hypothetical protein
MAEAAAELMDQAEAQHHKHTVSLDRLQELAANSSSGDRDGAPAHQHSGKSCAFAHVHCCAAAILTTSQVIVAVRSTQLRQGRGCATPYGQDSCPPLRPPRCAA